jgi:hypothetical protein
VPTENAKKGCSSCVGALLLVLVSTVLIDVDVEVRGIGVVCAGGVGIMDVDPTHVEVDLCGLGIGDVEKTLGTVDVAGCVMGIWLVEFSMPQASGATKNARPSKFWRSTKAAS